MNSKLVKLALAIGLTLPFIVSKRLFKGIGMSFGWIDLKDHTEEVLKGKSVKELRDLSERAEEILSQLNDKVITVFPTSREKLRRTFITIKELIDEEIRIRDERVKKAKEKRHAKKASKSSK